MKIEIFLGRKEVQAVAYGRILTVPLKICGKTKTLVINLRFIAIWFYR